MQATGAANGTSSNFYFVINARGVSSLFANLPALYGVGNSVGLDDGRYLHSGCDQYALRWFILVPLDLPLLDNPRSIIELRTVN